MEKVSICELKNYIGKEVIVEGFVDSIRNLQYVQFIILRDDKAKIQITVEKSIEKNKTIIDIVNNITIESTLKVTGKLVENNDVKLNGIEIIPSKIEITSVSSETLPFDYKKLENVNLDTRLDYRFIDLRNEKNMLIFKIESSMVQYMREYLYSHDFMEIHTPKLIGAASESGSEVFEVKYFDRKAYLAQSPQFYKQMAIAAGFNKVFEVAPCFRAENSNTNRHATEFTSFDVEFSYIDSFDDVMNLEAEMISYGIEKVINKYGDKIESVFGQKLNIPKLPFPKMRLSDIYKELEERYGYIVEESEKNDLTTEAEKLCYKLVKEKYNHEFLFVIDYPAEKRAFYHMRDQNGVLQGYDLIWRGVEITSGAQREHRYEEICKNAKSKGLDKDVQFYLEFFKYGCPPHGGFAIGVDRLIMLMLGIPTVKESMFLFRGPNRLNP